MVFVDTQNSTQCDLAGPCDLRIKGHNKFERGDKLSISGVYAIEFKNHAAEGVVGFNRISVGRGLAKIFL